jgi:dihydroxy-acid dehydratase
MSHFVRIGGLRPLLKTLLEEGLLHGDCITVTGKTLAENVQNAAPYAPYPSGQDLVRPFDQPIKKDSHLRILYGNLSPEGSVAKITGKEGLKFTWQGNYF